jgi:hypothetical protein
LYSLIRFVIACTYVITVNNLKQDNFNTLKNPWYLLTLISYLTLSNHSVFVTIEVLYIFLNDISLSINYLCFFSSNYYYIYECTTIGLPTNLVADISVISPFWLKKIARTPCKFLHAHVLSFPSSEYMSGALSNAMFKNWQIAFEIN